MKSIGAMTRWAIALLAAAAACAGLLLGLWDADALKAAIDRLSPDGLATTFPAERVAAVQARLRWAACGWGLMALLAARPPAALRALLVGPGPGEPWWRRSRQRLARFAREEPLHAALLLGITALGAGLTLAALDRPIRHDEATTFLGFVRRSAYVIASVYETNNHIFHNLLAALSVRAFGDAPWALRLPAALAGVASLPLAYLALRIQIDRQVALLSTALMAGSVYLVDSASNARGYSILTAIFLALLALAPRLTAPGASAARIAFIALSAVGFFTVPTMVYPFAAVGLWLLLHLLRDVERGRRLATALQLALLALVTGLVVLALYSPALVVSEPRQLVANRVLEISVQPSRLSLLRGELRVLPELFRYWTFGLPSAVRWLLLLGLAASPLLHRRLGRFGGRLLLAVVLSRVAVHLATGMRPPTWIFPFAVPVFLGLSVAGLLAIVRALPGASPERVERGLAATAIVTCLMGSWIQLGQRAGDRVPWYTGYRDAEAAARYLAGVLGPRDRIVAPPMVTRPVLYYLVHGGRRGDPFALVGTAADEEIGRIYLIDGGPDVVAMLPGSDRGLVQRRRDLAARGFDREELALSLADSQIFRLSRSDAPSRGER